MKYFLLLAAILFAGCDSGKFQLVPISGTITMDGQAIEGAQVVFAPMESKDIVEVGPISIGMTDAEGKYSLKTVKGRAGAVVTSHRVAVAFPEVSEAEIAAKVDEVTTKNVNMPERQVIALEKRVRKSMLKTQSIPARYNKQTVLRFVVEGSTENADFELNSDGS